MIIKETTVKTMTDTSDQKTKIAMLPFHDK